MLVMVGLDSNSEKPHSIENAELIKPTGNLPTPAEGTGMARVRKTEPVPLPQHTLPATRTGSKTLDNPYILLNYQPTFDPWAWKKKITVS